MKEERILDALGKVRASYIAESAPGSKKARPASLRWVAAAVIVMMLVFFKTSPGIAAADFIKEQIDSLIKALFPPKDISVILEGEDYDIHHESGGAEPEFSAEGTVSKPGFAIYYDIENYTMTEEDGVTFIRFNIENELPPCEMEIRHLPGILPEDAAEAAREEMLLSWETVSEIGICEKPQGLRFHASAGNNWDSACEEVCFTADGQGSCFKISYRYFLEAAEGHGVRFAAMLQTFELIEDVP